MSDEKNKPKNKRLVSSVTVEIDPFSPSLSTKAFHLKHTPPSLDEHVVLI
jgi:hypothetical protein